MPLFKFLWKKGEEEEESSGDEIEDESAGALSYVGTAAYDVLRRHYNHYHKELWNVTYGKKVGKLQFTPSDAFTRNESSDPPEGLDDWFPEKIGEIIARTEDWCDIMTLAPPDGAFLEAFKKALAEICAKPAGFGGRIVIRIMFGNVVGMPVNCNRLIKELTKDLPYDAPAKIKLWVGSWRKGVSWNHAKIIAVDGKYLWTGGHNFWTKHYLSTSPANDLSFEMEGGPAKDAHRFANAQWGYIVKKQSTAWGRFVDKNIPDALDVPRKARVTISEFPESNAAEYPPYYKEPKQLRRRGPYDPEYVPCITMGRYGAILKKARPSDAAFVAMLDSAQTIIRCALQDLGPVCLPNTKITLPGCVWPYEYLDALARVIWVRGVDVEIVLSNPNSIPGGCSPTEANYGNGWSCVDVAAEIIKRIQVQFPDAHDGDLRQKVRDNLRICFLKSPRGGYAYKDGATLGLHSKHFIIDDIACYIGSQNLYICDLAEWGVLIDDAAKTEEIKSEYWDPMWKVSYIIDDCEVDKVMDGLEIDRSAPSKLELTKLQLQQVKERERATQNIPQKSEYFAKPKEEKEGESDSEESEASDGEE